MDEKDSIISLSKIESTALKGIAIIMVLLGHMGYIKWGGAGGVSLFLILSGYGIDKTRITDKLKNFWKKRIQNIWLPYVMITIVLLIGKDVSDWRNVLLQR